MDTTGVQCLLGSSGLGMGERTTTLAFPIGGGECGGEGVRVRHVVPCTTASWCPRSLALPMSGGVCGGDGVLVRHAPTMAMLLGIRLPAALVAEPATKAPGRTLCTREPAAEPPAPAVTVVVAGAAVAALPTAVVALPRHVMDGD